MICYLLFVSGMTITISKNGYISLIYENSQGSSQVDEYFVFPSSAYAFEITDAISKIHMEISSLSLQHTAPNSSSIPTSTQVTVFFDSHRQRVSTTENKSFRAAVMGLNIDITTSENSCSINGIVFSHLKILQNTP